MNRLALSLMRQPAARNGAPSVLWRTRLTVMGDAPAFRTRMKEK